MHLKKLSNQVLCPLAENSIQEIELKARPIESMSYILRQIQKTWLLVFKNSRSSQKRDLRTEPQERTEAT